jgi:uncharacterized protein with HEPN domain
MRKDDAYLDLNVVWDTIERDLPPLISHLETYLAANPPPES